MYYLFPNSTASKQCNLSIQLYSRAKDQHLLYIFIPFLFLISKFPGMCVCVCASMHMYVCVNTCIHTCVYRYIYKNFIV